MDKRLKNRAIHRAKIIRGQLSGLINAIEKEVYCADLMEQSLSIQKSLKSLDAFLLENHLKTHVRRQMSKENSASRAVKELVSLYTLSNK